jgi:diacylglycerol O-acyltransferase
MHVGWVALFSPPEGRPKPTFAELREHVAGHLRRAPRYRQRLAGVPFGVHDPVWIDDERFDIERHVRRSRASSLGSVVNRVMSTPLDRAEPLWQLWIADNLADGRIGIAGKAHHCMVDGIAAVELAAILLDDTPDPPPPPPDDWRPSPPPGSTRILVDAVRDRMREPLNLIGLPVRVARSPGRVLELAQDAERVARALGHSFGRPAPRSMLNAPISPLRHLAVANRPLEDFRRIKRRFRTTINDVVLAVASGGVRRFMERRGEEPRRLKTMVPVSVREQGSSAELGNRISFVFVELPCDEPDPVRRLLDVHVVMSDRKASGEPQGGEAVFKAVSYAPHSVQHAVSRMVASPRAFNLVVSNIPGPRLPLYMLGCELEEAYPVVPLADQHALSIGVTTIKDGAFFGVYADRRSLPDAELLAADINASIDELLQQSP